MAISGRPGGGRQPAAGALQPGRMPAALLLPLLAALLLGSMLVSAGKGAYPVPLRAMMAMLLDGAGMSQGGFDPQQATVLWEIRLPRVVMGALVGALLGMAGAAMQALFRNPLADPGLIGVSGGAALAVALATVFGAWWWPGAMRALGMAFLPAAAFAGGTATTWLIYRIGRTPAGVSVATMLLAGIAFNAIAAALIGVASYAASNEQLRDLAFWNLGSLGGADWRSIAVVAAGGLVAMGGMASQRTGLNALSLGEAEARHLGIRVGRLKTLSVVFGALGVGMAVAFCGVIGFVGLVAPHCVRLIAGPDARTVLPGAALLGALLTVAADLAARTLAGPAEMPIGVLTALIGAPFFLALLLRSRHRLDAA